MAMLVDLEGVEQHGTPALRMILVDFVIHSRSRESTSLKKIFPNVFWSHGRWRLIPLHNKRRSLIDSDCSNDWNLTNYNRQCTSTCFFSVFQWTLFVVERFSTQCWEKNTTAWWSFRDICWRGVSVMLGSLNIMRNDMIYLELFVIL